MPLTTVSMGPFKGVTSVRNPSLDPQQMLRYARNFLFTGVNAMSIRPGQTTALTFYDDQGTPAVVTSVRGYAPFTDGALAIAYSSVTQKVYLYRLTATMDDWYDGSGALQGNTSPEPIGVLWTSVVTPPDVHIAEGLGVAYITNTGALDQVALYYPSKTYEDFGTIATLKANGTGGSVGTDDAYFTGCVPFNQHLWVWGYGAGSTPGFTSYRPEMARFSQPNFDPFQQEDSITLGDRVRSVRERVLGGFSTGQALYLGGDSMLSRITGQGRDSWYKEQIDRSYGIVGPKCYAVLGTVGYYWSPRGPMRITDTTEPDALYDAIPDAVSKVASPASIIAVADPDRDQVFFLYDTGSHERTFCVFDTRREVWLGPDADVGLAMGCAGVITPIYASTTRPPGPSGAPTAVSTTSISSTTATITWTAGDVSATTEVSLYVNLRGWAVYTTVAAGTASYMLSDLNPSTLYIWRVRHYKNGQYSGYNAADPVTEFLTSATTLLPPTGLSASTGGGFLPPTSVHWTNSGESGVSTEIWAKLSTDPFYSLSSTAGVGASSVTVFLGSGGSSHDIKVRHVRGSAQSAFTSSVTT